METAEDLANYMAKRFGREPVTCRADARLVLAYLSEAGLLVSDVCGTTLERYGFQVRRGEGQWSPVHGMSRDLAATERAAVGACRGTENYRLVVQIVHEGPWREVEQQ